MKRIHWILFFLAVIALMGFRHWAEEKGAHAVAKVFDGDTIRLDDGRKIRLTGVDAPEVDSPYARGEPGGCGSRDYLKAMLEGKRVVVKVGEESIDRYGRTLAMVYLGEVLVNGRIIRDGWARAYRRFDYPCKDLFMAYEAEARARGIGMWKEENAVGPGWERE
jgi:micrococcal nuclease